MIVWKMIKIRFRTAQNAPPGWFGTVLFLKDRDRQQSILSWHATAIRDIVRISSVERSHIEVAIRECIDGLDVVNQYEDARREYEQEGDDAQCTDNVESYKYTCRIDSSTNSSTTRNKTA